MSKSMSFVLFLCVLIMWPSIFISAEEELDELPHISADNFPILDGSDSTTPLRYILMCNLLGINYSWKRDPHIQHGGPKYIETEYSKEIQKLKRERMLESNTHIAFNNLILGYAELILSARSMSADEKELADQKEVTLLEKPIARDALSFIIHPDNPVKHLTTKQIQDIYLGKIVNWQEVGGDDVAITPYIRNRNSGSQEKFESMVMKGMELPEYKTMNIGKVMMAPYWQIEQDPSGIAYTPFYYFSVVVDNDSTKVIDVDGVEMTKQNVCNGTYPYQTEVFAVVRADINKSSPAYQVFEFLTTPRGQAIVEESGYVPLRTLPDHIITPDSTNPSPTAIHDLQGRRMQAVPQRGVFVRDRKVVISD